MCKRTWRVIGLALLALLLLAAYWIDEKHPLQVKVIRNRVVAVSAILAELSLQEE